jgi:hypothetical protein
MVCWKKLSKLQIKSLETNNERKDMKIGQPLRVIEAVPVPDPATAPEKEKVEENV